MENIYFTLSLVLIFSFWIHSAYKIAVFYGIIENAKSWVKKEAVFEKVVSASSYKSHSKNPFIVMFRSIFLPEKFNIFAYYYVDDIKIGAYNFSLYPSYERHISFFARKVLRLKLDTIDVYVNPDKGHESIFIPASEHKFTSKLIWFGIKTFFLTLIILYLLF